MEFERPDIVRPPSEWQSYFLPLTNGCSNNSCTFCRNYGAKLQIREVEDIRREIDAVALYAGSGLRLPGMPAEVYAASREWDGRRVFLQDSDALVYPYAGLCEVLRYLGEKLPSVGRVAAYATPQDILRRSPSELRELSGLKLGILFVGLETGDDELLQKVGKGVSSSEMVEAGRKARHAGIQLSVSIILGLGGVAGSERHALATARVLSEIDPEYAGALTLTLVPGTPLHDEWRRGHFVPITPFESLRELLTMIENSSFTNCFFSSMHASNYWSVRGRLPQDKKKMVDELRHVLEQGDSSSLRPEFLRGL
ncbi:MAG: radical SAM protein [Dehalococcoidia bacterium]|nr:radical SAM protein [Dehalococcoidia bacterium]